MKMRFLIWLCFYRYLNLVSRNELFLAINLPVVIVFKIYSVFIGVDISYKTKIGLGFKIDHGFGLVIHYKAKIGNNVRCRNGVTIGAKNEYSEEVPTIGNNVSLGAHAIILGDISIGDNAVIGAGSVVLLNVPENQVWAGVPACRIK